MSERENSRMDTFLPVGVKYPKININREKTHLSEQTL